MPLSEILSQRLTSASHGLTLFGLSAHVGFKAITVPNSLVLAVDQTLQLAFPATVLPGAGSETPVRINAKLENGGPEPESAKVWAVLAGISTPFCA